MNIFYSMQQNLKVRNNSQHHNIKMTVILGMETLEKKPKMGKPMQQSDIDFIMRKYGTLQSLQIQPNLSNAATWQNHWTNSQLNLSTLLQECTTQLYGLTRVDPYGCCTEYVRSVRLLYEIRME